MRLQVVILRHTLSPVNIIYNTSAPQKHVRTIADLLAAIDKIVPLESNDGEWGLEDYVVEVAATSDQTNVYECLHYQLIKDVFKEDDEVVIRGLTSDELRERRQGGRLQILSDGRHLFDGVAWGRRYNVNSYRPGIAIPPRKRRRLLPPEEEDETDQDHTPLQISYTESDIQYGTMIENGDDDEGQDGDFEYEEEMEDEDDDDDSDDSMEENEHQIVARQEFEDADTPSVSGDEQSGSNDEVESTSLEQDELQLLLREAGEVEEAYHSLPLECRVTSPPRKRKRLETQNDQLDEKDLSFEGFSSPATERKSNSTGSRKLNRIVKDKIGNHIVTQPHESDGGAGIDDTDTENGGSTFLDDHYKTEKPKLNGDLNIESSVENGGDSSESTSSSGESESDTDDESETRNDVSESESNSDSTTSSGESDSDSDSDSEDTSSSGESDSDSESEPESESESKAVAAPQLHSLQTAPSSNDSNGEPTSPSKKDNPPGSGTKRTRSNNNRIKLRKRLMNLKEQGILPVDADFDMLRAYEADGGMLENLETSKENDVMESELALRKEEMLLKLTATYEQEQNAEISRTEYTPVDDEDDQTHDQSTSQQKNDQQLHESPIEQVTTSAEDVEDAAQITTPQKRARLDVASARRMLFSSLGVRNPKTPAAEQALREQLAKPVRNIQTRQPEIQSTSTKTTVKNSADSWKDKLIISAIECVQEGLLLPTPPFPFKQHWEVRNQKRKTNEPTQDDEAHINTEAAAEIMDEIADEPQPDFVSSSKVVELSINKDTNLDDIPYPTDFESFPQLSQKDVRVGAIIAYKHLQIGPRYEPEESPFRVARIIAINDDSIDLQLSRRCLDSAIPFTIDEETGERTYSKFEVPIDEYYSEDTGLRESTFEELITPKLMYAGEVQVPSSDENPKLALFKAQTHEDSVVIPDSGPLHGLSSSGADIPHVEIDTPRRKEIVNIMEDAGFTSAVDEQLLLPISVTDKSRSEEIPVVSSRQSSVHSSQEKPRSKAPRKEMKDLWRSSSVEPDAENDTSQVESKAEDVPQMDISSPPTVSLIETVDYPHISHIEINQSSVVDHGASSSLQDAQRISPAISDIEHSSLTHLRLKPFGTIVREDSQVSSLASEVPLSQTNGASTQIPDQDLENTSQSPSTKLRGGGMDDEYQQESEDVDSDDLPSLRTLTSSQKRSNRSAKSRHSPHSLRNVSPPPLRKTLVSVDIEEPSSEPQIKISASQKPIMSLSQIPTDASIVDLTMSSDPVEPPHDYTSDEYESPRAKRIAMRNVKVANTSSQKKDQVGAKRSARDVIGATIAKRDLSRKKKRSGFR